MNRSALLYSKSAICGKVNPTGRRMPIVWIVLEVLILAASPAPMRAEHQAWLRDGTVRQGELTAAVDRELAFVPSDGSPAIPLSQIRQIQRDSPPRLVWGDSPVRQIIFRGGERVHGELIWQEDGGARFSGLGATEQPVPRDVLWRIMHPAGERLVAYDDFELPPGLFDSPPTGQGERRSGKQSLCLGEVRVARTFRLARPLDSGRVTLAYFDAGSTPRPVAWRIGCEFQQDDRQWYIQFCTDEEGGEYRCRSSAEVALEVFPVPRTDGWRRVTWRFERRRVLVFLDDQLLARGLTPAGALISVRLEPRDSANARSPSEPEPVGKNGSGKAEWIDDFQIYETAETTESLPAPVHSKDLVDLPGGVRLLGAMQSFDPQRVQMEGVYSRRVIPWTEVRGVWLGPREGAPLRSVTGQIATVDLAPIWGAGNVPADRLILALVEGNPTALVAEHPWLGRLTLPLREVSRIEPSFQGTLHVLDPATHHLGGVIREDFTVKLAEGGDREWRFQLEEVPPRGVFLSLLAADLDPHRQIPKGDRAGTADAIPPRTQLLLNGRRLGDLNRHVKERAPAGRPQRLRISLPVNRLKAGENRLRLRQQPAGNTGEFDDWELSRLALEIER